MRFMTIDYEGEGKWGLWEESELLAEKTSINDLINMAEFLAVFVGTKNIVDLSPLAEIAIALELHTEREPDEFHQQRMKLARTINARIEAGELEYGND